MAISSIPSVANLQQIQPPEQLAGKSNATSTISPSAEIGESGFSDVVKSFFKQTNDAQVGADTAIQDFVTGKSDNIQNVVLAMANADMSFQFFLEIRNKVIESYSELMRMQF